MDDYTENWQRYRRARTILLLVWIGYLPGVPAIAWVISKVLRREANDLWIPVALVWMAAFAITGFRVQCWKCPRCGNWFSAKWYYNKSFLARKCVHCGLPKFATHS